MTWRPPGRRPHAVSGTIRADPLPRRANWIWLIVFGGILQLASCGGEPRLVESGTPTPAPGAVVRPSSASFASPAAEAPAIGEVVWTTASDPAMAAAESVDHYATDASRLVAAIPASNMRPGSTVDATWTYNDTPLEAFATRLTIDGTAPERWLSFHLERAPDIPWPSGLYEVAISLDGAPVRTASVEVRDPE